MKMKMKQLLLETSDLYAGYGQLEVLHGINLSVQQNEVVALLGANGAGKSSLLMTIMGKLKALSGKIRFNNLEITNLATYEIAKLGIALVPEGRRIFPDMTIQENLQLGNFTAANPKDYSYLTQIYELFPILKQRANLQAGNLSGGEQQMLAIGRALMSKPKLLLLDEPSLGLAPQIVTQIYEVLTEVAKNNTSILLIEQNVTHAIRLADKFYILANGHITQQGSREDFLASPNIEKHYFGM